MWTKMCSNLLELVWKRCGSRPSRSAGNQCYLETPKCNIFTQWRTGSERLLNAFWTPFERLLNGYGLVRVRLRVWTAPNVDFFTPLYGLTRVNFGFERVHTGSYGFQRRSKPLNVKFPQKLFRVVDFRCLTLLMSDLSLPPQYSGPNGLDKTHNLYIWSVLVKSKTLPILFWGDSEPLKFEWENCPPFVGELQWRITPQVNDQRLQVGRWPIHLVVPRHVLKDLWAVRSGFNLRLTTASRLEHLYDAVAAAQSEGDPREIQGDPDGDGLKAICFCIILDGSAVKHHKSI